MITTYRFIALAAWALVLMPATLAFGGDGNPHSKFNAEQNEECTDCHDDIPEMLIFTQHRAKYEVGCTSCHGYSEDHVDDPLPENINGGKGQKGMEACLSCHEADIHEARPHKNMHASQDVFCSDCHSVHQHKTPQPGLLAKKQTDLCLSCHQNVADMMRRPFTHKVEHGAVECSSCHDPHGGKGRNMFPHGDMEAACADCHADKQGPFVFPHVTGVAGDCMSCHTSHGSSNKWQLTRANTSQLCMECHSNMPGPELGSGAPSFHDPSSPRYRDCTSCHTAIHGSSRSPALLK